MDALHIAIGTAVAFAAATLVLSGLAIRRRFFHRCTACPKSKDRVRRRVWRLGGATNYMELFEQPDGNFAYDIHRGYTVDCPKCQGKNTSGWLWTIPFEEGADPLPAIGSPRLNFTCPGCREVHSFAPQIGPSEWLQRPAPETVTIEDRQDLG